MMENSWLHDGASFIGRVFFLKQSINVQQKAALRHAADLNQACFLQPFQLSVQLVP